MKDEQQRRSFMASDALYERALRTIPLASQTFSKSAMNYVKGASPLFASRGHGGEIWDIDDNGYIDFVGGLLPVILGYGDPDVDGAIRSQLDKGITLSLATELEVELAETLVRLIPCAEMVRFGKTGTDATSAAVRLARAATGRDKIVICGYHGWQDWYIGSTARHLGVPEAVRALTLTFPYNDAAALERILSENACEVAAVVMEPTALTPPQPGFLAAVRDLSTRHGALLVFDEIITGFRMHLGGAQSIFGVTPDIGCFGKSMANGMPISAVVGRRDVMKFMDDIFFSGTFGGECLSLAAAIATIAKLERLNGPERLTALGRRLAGIVETALAVAGLDLHFHRVGGDWWPGLLAKPQSNYDAVLLNSLLRQELIAEGILMGATLNLSLAHDSEPLIARVEKSFAMAFSSVARALATEQPWSCLRGEPIRPVFAVRPAPKQ